jgi:ABC-type transport system, involved in lipoprotein release, permease component
MFKNYFKTAIRNLTRNKTYTAINVFGLAIGVAVCLIIFLVIRFETSFDTFHKKKDRIYRVISEFHDANGVNTNSGVPFPLPKTLRADFPQLEKVSAIYSPGEVQTEVLDSDGQISKKLKEKTGAFFTEPDFFAIFDFKWLTGSPSSLADPNTAALSKTTAEKYFGDWKMAIGKTLKMDNRWDLKIIGILEDVPANTDFQFKIVASFKTLKAAASTDWVTVSSSMGCYFLLPGNVSPEKIESLLPSFIKKYKPAEYVKDGALIQPLSKVHYDAETGNFLRRTISKELINALMFIAAFILIIACVNFINLSTAQAVNRSKEVGIRKVLGSGRSQLRLQFLSETTIIVLAAVVFSILIVLISLPPIKKILDLPLSNNFLGDPAIFLFLLFLIPLVVFLSGFYPSLILSKFNPVTALKSKAAARSTKGITLRKGLVVVQFVIAQALIIGTLIIVKQMNYFTSKSMGFDKEAIITAEFPNDSAGISKINYLKNKLSQQKEVAKFSISFGSPADNGGWYSDFRFDNAQKATNFGANLKWADDKYLDTYGLQLIAGRNLRQSDTANEFLVNEKLLSMLGVTNPEAALNKQINLWDGRVKAKIVGVLKDFHSTSFRDPIAPVLIGSNKQNYYMAGIKLRPGNYKDAIKNIEKIWNEVYPDYVFEYQFLDEKIARFYTQESKLSNLYKLFAIIAILLSCLGLYGLASFMAVQRIKEVGIRKVLGASVKSVIYLFSKEFIILISIAFVFATAIAYYFMHKWLQAYPYRIDLSWWIFALAGLLSLLIALITVSSQAIKAAIANPVKNLRTE